MASSTLLKRLPLPGGSLSSFKGILLIMLTVFSRPATALESRTVSQYGITWTFDKPYPVGQFITGDWWVVGPVTVVGVSPAPGPAPADEAATSAKSIYGDVMLVDDKRMRNGSMIVRGRDSLSPSGFGLQGYDSRSKTYDERLSLSYPVSLKPGESLISSASSEHYKDGKLATPCIIGELFQLGDLCHPEEPIALESGAVLTCLDQAPPADAFRPPYAGTGKPIYRASEIRWDLLPKLPPVSSAPEYDKMARAFERPLLDHCDSYLFCSVSPAQNGRDYGGIYSFLTASASLMLMADVPREKKEKLMIGLLQLGIDLHGLANSGRQWFSDGGIWCGRKWPILFASIMLDRPELRNFPMVDASRPVLYDHYMLEPTPGQSPTTLFSEDLDTYYGPGADGQSVLWQIVFHTYPREPYFERPFEQWSEVDRFSHRYFWVPGEWSATALAAQLMKARAIWNHEAFFDFADWYMAPGRMRYLPTGEKKPAFSRPFFRECWDKYRSLVPGQPGGQGDFKWVWHFEGNVRSARSGSLVPNPPPH